MHPTANIMGRATLHISVLIVLISLITINIVFTAGLCLRRRQTQLDHNRHEEQFKQLTQQLTHFTTLVEAQNQRNTETWQYSAKEIQINLLKTRQEISKQLQEKHTIGTFTIAQGILPSHMLRRATTMMAILTTASAVLKDSATRKQIHIIQAHLGHLAKDFQRFQSRMDNLSRHIKQAHDDVSDVNTSAKKITNHFHKIENCIAG